MPEPKKKLVKVDDAIVAFPSDMEDEHIAAAIKAFKQQDSDQKKHTHFTSPRPTGKMTEESEHARQLKAAQPLSTVLPKLPDWATRPLASNPEQQDAEAIPADPQQEQAANARLRRTVQPAATYLAEHPKTKAAGDIVQAVGEGVAQTAAQFTSPVNLALLAALPESKLLSALFAVQAARGSYTDAAAARKAYLEGNNPEAVKYATQALLGLGVAGLAGHHAIKDTPLGEAIKSDVKTLATGGHPAEAGFIENPLAPKSVKVPPAKLDRNVESEPGYAYHATNSDRLQEIADSGKLKIFKPNYGTDQNAWPDRSIEKRAYFSPNASAVWQFAPEEGSPVILRTKSAGLKKEGTGDLYSPASIPSKELEYLGQDRAWHSIRNLATPKVEAGNRTYYRGSNPENTEKIKTGDDYWDSLLFVADDPRHATNYGRTIEKVQLKPDTTVLREGTPQFRKVAGAPKKGESLLEFSSRAAKSAQDAGYDAVHFQLQGTVGTAILNRDAIESREPHIAPKLSDVKAQAAKLMPTTAYKAADQSQPFYLKSENVINEKMRGPMPATDLQKMLLANGVKEEEMKWTGLDEFLTSKGKNKVTPQEIQEHLAGNNLQVQEVQKGDNFKQQMVIIT